MTKLNFFTIFVTYLLMIIFTKNGKWIKVQTKMNKRKKYKESKILFEKWIWCKEEFVHQSLFLKSATHKIQIKLNSIDIFSVQVCHTCFAVRQFLVSSALLISRKTSFFRQFHKCAFEEKNHIILMIFLNYVLEARRTRALILL